MILAPLLVSSACLQEQRTPEAYTERMERLSVSATDTATPPAAIAPRAGDPAAPLSSSSRWREVTLLPQAAPRLRGTASLRGSGSATVVDVRLQAERGGNYDGAIHRGSCTRLGPQVVSLYAVSADSAGAGRAVSFARVPIDTLLAYDHVLIYGSGGRPETCVAITDTSTVPADIVRTRAPAPRDSTTPF